MRMFLLLQKSGSSQGSLGTWRVRRAKSSHADSPSTSPLRHPDSKRGGRHGGLHPRLEPCMPPAARAGTQTPPRAGCGREAPSALPWTLPAGTHGSGRPAGSALSSKAFSFRENTRIRKYEVSKSESSDGGSGLFLGESGAPPGCFPPAAPVLQGRPPRTELLPLSRASPRRMRSCRDAPRTRDPTGSGENRGPGTVRRCPWF